LPFDKLKVDRGFVAALDHSANAGVIIQAVIALGRALNLSILVEGIETEEQRALVRLAGCDEMQGYLFARPAPPEEIDRLLVRQNAQRNPAPVGRSKAAFHRRDAQAPARSSAIAGDATAWPIAGNRLRL
jgi:predicted signal transduction protein with EAL and GGDEF domain